MYCSVLQTLSILSESYQPREIEPSKSQERWARYGELLEREDCPVNFSMLSWEEWQQEPLYQLLRQQLLASALERTHAHDADRVRVVHLSPAGNESYQQSLTPAARLLGDSVSEVWSALLRTPDRFAPLDSSLFLRPEITSEEYCARYG